MRKTTKNPKRVVRSTAKAKKATPEKFEDAVAAPVYKPEPAYININEHQAEIAAKSRVLWTVVIIFSVILAIFWIIILRQNIKKEASGAGFNEIGDQISKSLARFDTEIKNRAPAKTISADDLAAIKTGLEDQIKNNPDSSLWPTHEFTTLGFSLQYPDGWNKIEGNKETEITDAHQTSSTVDQTTGLGKIAIASKANAKKYDLMTWLQKNKLPDASYVAERPLFAASSSRMENLVFNVAAPIDGQLSKIIYLNVTSSKSVLEIRITAQGDMKYYEPLTEEIVRTIKLLK